MSDPISKVTVTSRSATPGISIPLKRKTLVPNMQSTMLMEVIASSIPNTTLKQYGPINNQYNVIHMNGYVAKYVSREVLLSVSDRLANYNSYKIRLSISIGVIEVSKYSVNFYSAYANTTECDINIMIDDIIKKIGDAVAHHLYANNKIAYCSLDSTLQDMVYAYGILVAVSDTEYMCQSIKPLYVACKHFGTKPEYAEYFYKTDPKLWFMLLKNENKLTYDETYFKFLLANYEEAACIYLTFCGVRDDTINNVIIKYPHRIVAYCSKINRPIFEPHMLQILNPEITHKFVEYYRSQFPSLR